MKLQSSLVTSPSAAPESMRVQRRRAKATPIGDFDYRRSDELVHRGLATRNLQRRAPGMVVDHDDVDTVNDALRELAAVQYIESKFLNEARIIVAQHAAEAPTDADGLIGWLESLRLSGPGQLDPLLGWMATSANEEALRWHVQQELAADIGSNELVNAVRAKGINVRPLARLADLATLIGVELPATTDAICWEALARSNLMIALASTRRWANHAIGALIAIMMTTPQRAATIETALRRLGYEVYPPAPAYDPAAVAEMVRKAIAADPTSARAIAEGALVWMHFRVRCQSRYRAQLVA